MTRRTAPRFDRLIEIPSVSEGIADPFGQTETGDPDYDNASRIWAERMPISLRDQQPTTRTIADGIQIIYAKWTIRGSDEQLLDVGDTFRDDQGQIWEVEGKQPLDRYRYFELYCKAIA